MAFSKACFYYYRQAYFCILICIYKRIALYIGVILFISLNHNNKYKTQLLLPNIATIIFFIGVDGLGSCTFKDKRTLIIMEKVIIEIYNIIFLLFFCFNSTAVSKNITMAYAIIMRINIYKFSFYHFSSGMEFVVLPLPLIFKCTLTTVFIFSKISSPFFL